MNKGELIVSVADLEQLKVISASGADALQIGHEDYGLRVAGNFSLDDIFQAREYTQKHNKKLYILVNNLFHNEDLAELKDYLKELAILNVDAIIFGDPAVYLLVQQYAPNIPLFWHAETLVTNYQTIDYWGGKGIKRAILARELSLQEVLEIKEKTKVEIQIQIHGLTTIFHSKRNLLTSYLDNLNFAQINNLDKHKVNERQQFYLREHKRSDQYYPIWEDRSGTHIMSYDDIMMIEHLEPLLTVGIDGLYIEGLLKNTDYLQKVVMLYREALDKQYNNTVNSEEKTGWVKEIEKIQPNNRPLTTGFYFRKLYY